jgi:hypothetical protein
VTGTYSDRTLVDALGELLGALFELAVAVDQIVADA